MVTTAATGSTTPTMNENTYGISSPFYLHPSESTGVSITPVMLRGDNYDEWARSMRDCLRAKNKLGFVDGTIKEPEIGSKDYEQWGRVNSMLGAWIYVSIDHSIRSSVTIVDSVKVMWDDLKERFSIGNGPRVHELKQQLMQCTQKGHTIVAYYGKLKMIWDELANYSKLTTCSCGCKCGAAAALAKEKEEEKIHYFLIGLDPPIYGDVASNLLLMDPLPSLNAIFSNLLLMDPLPR